MNRLTLQKMESNSSEYVVEFNSKILKDSIAELKNKMLMHLRKT